MWTGTHLIPLQTLMQQSRGAWAYMVRNESKIYFVVWTIPIPRMKEKKSLRFYNHFNNHKQPYRNKKKLQKEAT